MTTTNPPQGRGWPNDGNHPDTTKTALCGSPSPRTPGAEVCRDCGELTARWWLKYSHPGSNAHRCKACVNRRYRERYARIGRRGGRS